MREPVTKRTIETCCQQLPVSRRQKFGKHDLAMAVLGSRHAASISHPHSTSRAIVQCRFRSQQIVGCVITKPIYLGCAFLTSRPAPAKACWPGRGVSRDITLAARYKFFDTQLTESARLRVIAVCRGNGADDRLHSGFFCRSPSGSEAAESAGA